MENNELNRAARQALDLLAANPAQVLYMVQDYDRLSQRVQDLERRVRESNSIDARRSSIEVGTPAKGGNMKVYFDPFAEPIVNDRAIEEAQRVLRKAGGQRQEGLTMPPLHERIDTLVQQADGLRAEVHKEFDILRFSDLIRHTRHLSDVPGHLIEAEACIDRAMDDLCRAATAAQLGGM